MTKSVLHLSLEMFCSCKLLFVFFSVVFVGVCVCVLVLVGLGWVLLFLFWFGCVFFLFSPPPFCFLFLSLGSFVCLALLVCFFALFFPKCSVLRPHISSSTHLPTGPWTLYWDLLFPLKFAESKYVLFFKTL